jgi:tetratricopeptide (TPR) repeat protein
MRRSVIHLFFAIALACGVSSRPLDAQTPTPGGGAFAGRWEITLKPPANAATSAEIPLFILEVTGSNAVPSVKVVDSMASGQGAAKTGSISVKGDLLTVAVQMGAQTVVFTGKRVGDHLEGTAMAAGDPAPQSWKGQATTKDKLTPLSAEQVMAGQRPDQKAYTAALGKMPADRVAALKQFAADFPDSPLKEQASLTLAMSYSASAEKIAALKQFLVDFPSGAQKDQANLNIALAAPAAADRATGLRKFIADFPTSRLREQAEYQLTLTFTAAAERQAAQERFIKDHPKSTYAPVIYQMWFDTLVREKPVNEARLGTVIDAMLDATPDRTIPTTGGFTMSQRAQAMNTVADRLMANDVMLDRALDVIQKGLAVGGEKEQAQTRSMYTTTMGEVLFKLKRYDEAGVALKKAMEIAGTDGDGELQLFLGKYDEVKGDETAALAAYFKAADLGSPMDTRASLERLFAKKYGSSASLEDKLDEMYRAKSKGFEPGHYARSGEAKDSKRVVLAELFTGAECGPCVAADLSFDGLSERYGHDTVAVLVYHLHIPGPDPMTNTDTEARAKLYGFNSTPSAVFDGVSQEIGGGAATGAGKIFADYEAKIETRLKAKPLADLSRLKAKVNGQTMAVSGQASLLSSAADRAGHASLHLAVVEDSVRYVGSNGVRFHNYVVRKLMRSPAGVVLQKAGEKLAVSESVETKSLSANLDAYLDQFMKTPFRGQPVSFKDRVDHLDAKKLLLVAFVQDDQTKEILQAAFLKK